MTGPRRNGPGGSPRKGHRPAGQSRRFIQAKGLDNKRAKTQRAQEPPLNRGPPGGPEPQTLLTSRCPKKNTSKKATPPRDLAGVPPVLEATPTTIGGREDRIFRLSTFHRESLFSLSYTHRHWRGNHFVCKV